MKTENDFSALTIWGVFSTDPDAVASRVHRMPTAGRSTSTARSTDGAPKVMLMHAWQERLELHELVEKVAKSCKRLKVDKLLIEDKAAGHSVAQELRRLYSAEGFGSS
jgi:phage terminase large subunit-like protein